MNAIQKIVDGGYCIGCGACACATHGAIPVAMNADGLYQADAGAAARCDEDQVARAVSACPCSGTGPDEDDVGRGLYGADCRPDGRMGCYHRLFIGHVAEDGFRAGGSSGGFGSWILAELLDTGAIDAVAHARKVEAPTDGVLFRYVISRTVEEIKSGAKSCYYPVEMSGVLEQIRQTPGRYAVVGLPCFIQAVRRLAEIDPILKERIVHCIGLVCGHLKSKALADCFGWQIGIPPGRLEAIDFRVKLPDRPAGDYGVFLRGAGIEATRPRRNFLGARWGHNFFRYSACDCCDNVFAETADLTIGDAWLPEHANDPRCTNIVVVRDPSLSILIARAQEQGRVVCSPSEPDMIAESQAGGLRDRREGLAYRLHLKALQGEWAPRKRVEPDAAHLSAQRAQIYAARSAAGAASHRLWREALAQNDLAVFLDGMRPHVETIQKGYEMDKA